MDSSRSQRAVSGGKASFMPVRPATFLNSDMDSVCVARHDARAARGLGALLRPIAPGHVVLDDGLEFLGDMIALECHSALAIHVHRRGRHFARARQADADVRMAALARPIDD